MSTQKEKERLARNLKKVKPLLKQEKAVVTLHARKTVIAADLHGDLPTLEFILKAAASKKADACIFLGDYIDKGPDSVAVLNCLFELKCRFPKQVILLRGNHETRGLSGWFEFGRDLIQDDALLKQTNSVFKEMPIAAVLNDSVFCVHGNIAGRKNETLRDISKKNPTAYLWNDPGVVNGLSSSPRGSGVHRVGPDLIHAFLDRNRLQVMIRGHTSHTDGIQFWFDKRFLSLYSTFPYNHSSVRAAVAIVKKDHIRFYPFRKNKNRPEWMKKERQKLKFK